MTDEPESVEVWLRDGETWFADARALCKRLAANTSRRLRAGISSLAFRARASFRWLRCLLRRRPKKPIRATIPAPLCQSNPGVSNEC